MAAESFLRRGQEVDRFGLQHSTDTGGTEKPRFACFLFLSSRSILMHAFWTVEGSIESTLGIPRGKQQARFALLVPANAFAAERPAAVRS